MSLKALATDLRTFLGGDYADLMTDSRVYTPEEWAPRGEQYNSPDGLMLTTEDSLYDGLNYGGAEAFLANRFRDICDKHGFGCENVNGWMWIIYPQPVYS